MSHERLGHMLQQIGRIPAVVVGSADDICLASSKADVAGGALALLRAEVEQGDASAIGIEYRQEAIVGVLIDHENPQGSAPGLSWNRVEEPRQLRGAPDRRDDKIDRNARGHRRLIVLAEADPAGRSEWARV
jgi:hypothetical protein